MTKDEVLKLAQVAGFRAGNIVLFCGDPVQFVAPISATDCTPELERFAALVAKQSYLDGVNRGISAEREACAIACEVHAVTVMEPGSGTPWSACHECAAAIRSRGQA